MGAALVLGAAEEDGELEGFDDGLFDDGCTEGGGVYVSITKGESEISS